LTTARTTYYNTLAQRITSYFSRGSWTDRNDEELAKLRNAISKYEAEYDYSSVLSNFEKEYASDVAWLRNQ
jgi:hypothetical protein